VVPAIVPIDRAHVGFRLPIFAVDVEAAQIRQFSTSIGAEESDVAPLTYLKVIEGKNDSSRAIICALGVDLRRVMHAEQEFEYGEPVCSGDQVTVERVVADIFERKNGALEFVVVESRMTNQAGKSVGLSRQWILIRNAIEPG